MKNKPVSHKSQNTFRFLTFCERLNNVNIDVIRRVGKTTENPEDGNTFFQEAVEKWNDLNYTQDYESLKREIGYEIQTLSQVVFRKDVLIDILLKCLANNENMALDAALEFVWALARDLQFEFYPYFPKVFAALTQLLSTKDTELLEKVFTCLSYLFKFLWRYLVKDMQSAYSLFSSLLTINNKEHIRNFAAESFAFLIRKVKDKSAFFEFMFHLLEENPERAEGVGRLLFEVVKGIKGQFHSCTKMVLQILFKCLGNGVNENDSKNLPVALVEQSLSQMLFSVAKHASKVHVVVVEEVISEEILKLLDQLKESESKEAYSDYLSGMLRLLLFWANYRNGIFVSSNTRIIEVLVKFSHIKAIPSSCMEIMFDITASVLLIKHINVTIGDLKCLLNYIYDSGSEYNHVFYFTRKMLTYGMFEKDVLPRLLSYCCVILKKSHSLQMDVLEILTKTVTTLKPLTKLPEDVKRFAKLPLYTPHGDTMQSEDEKAYLENFYIQTLQSCKNRLCSEDMQKIWNCLVGLPHFRLLDVKAVTELLANLSNELIAFLSQLNTDSIEEAETVLFVLYEVLICWMCLGNKIESSTHYTLDYFVDLLKKFPKSTSVLRMIDLYLSQHNGGQSSHLSEEKLSTVLHFLLPNLASPFHLVRLFSLRILRSCCFQLTETENSELEKLSVIDICLEAEKILIQNDREKVKWLLKLKYPFVKKYIPSSLREQEYQRIAVYYLIGLLYINYSRLWKSVYELLQSWAVGASEDFWAIFKSHLVEVMNFAEEIGVKKGDPFLIYHAVKKSVLVNESVFSTMMNSFCKHEEVPDVVNHRKLLWEAMGHFPSVAQSKSPIVVPLLFKFIENEIARVDSTLAPSETLLKTEKDDKNSQVILEDMDDEEDDESNSEEDEVDDIDMSHSKRKKLSENESTRSINRNGDFESALETSVDIDSEIKDDNSLFDVNIDDEKDEENAFEVMIDDDNEIDESQSNIQDLSIDENVKSQNSTKRADLQTDFKNVNEQENHEHSFKGSRKRKRKSTSEIGVKNKRNVLKKTLETILSLFSKFKKPKTLHQSEDLQRLYYELLSYQDEKIQKITFDCIMTYNFEFLVPYKEHFYRILDNKTFKTEIVLFNLDCEKEVIQENHRNNALAVLMRLLYGKMLHKTGNNTSGKAQAHTRKALVLRFLAGCSSVEIKMFFDLVFAPFLEHVKDDALNVVRTIRQSINPLSVVPVRKMRSALNTLEVILKNLGSLMPDLLPWFLKVLLAVATMSSTLLEQRQELLPHCVTLLKLVRRQSIMRLIQFFKFFDHYNFSSIEIDAIFEAVIWPALPRFEFEALHQPPPLLRLFDVWSSNSRYFILFAKHHEEFKSLSILPRLMALYISNQVRPRVTGLLSKMFLQLLTFSDFEPIITDTTKISEISINHCISLPEITIKDVKDVTFGTKLLYPHIDTLLKRLRITIFKASQNPKRVLNNRDLKMLLRISEFVEDPEQSSELIRLLIPFLSEKRKLNADFQVLILSTICNLVKCVNDAKEFIRPLSPIFSYLHHQRSRQTLAKIFVAISEKDNSVKNLASIVEKINAWNPNFVEEPDYEMRQDGQTEALSYISQMTKTIDEDFIRIMIFNAAFMIRACQDLPLRDSASYLLQQIVKKCPDFQGIAPSMSDQLIFHTLLPEVIKGLRNKTEGVRFEFIRVLSVVLLNYGSHIKLLQLAQLSDHDQDMDFWENLLHIQVHRRARALLRFANRLKSGEIKMDHKVLVTYLIPIVSAFFFDASYKKHVHVIDASIETFEVILGQLPWLYYKHQLLYYLGLLLKKAEHHKTVIKIIVTVLNAFHFDLSSSQGLIENLQKTNLTKDKAKTLSNKENYEKSIEAVSDGPNEPELLVVDKEELKNDDVNKKCALSVNEATKIHRAIAKSILPQLHRSLMHKTKSDSEQKLAGRSFPEDEEILRVPVALAIVKLLQNLPQGDLQKNVPRLFLKMCHLLKSRAESIRETARDTLIKMMQSLGPNYFWYLLREMKGVMKKGYQVHVMTFTINSILLNLKDQLKSGDLDPSVSDLTEICMNELFGDTAEEKEVGKIVGKLKEARTSKSYSIYEMLSRFVSEGSLIELIDPLKKTLNSSRSHKVIKKCHECLRHVALGLAENTGLSIKGQFIFIHTLMSENLPSMCPKSNKKTDLKDKFVRPDIFLIPKEPGRSGPPAKTSIKTNAHVLVEFCLEFLHLCLKRGKCTDAKEHLEMLDPFVPILSNCIDSSHIKIITTSLRCFMWMFKFSLPSLKEHASGLVNSLFIILNKYAGVGLGQGENFEMVIMCFKMMTVVVRDTTYHTLNKEQLHVLLSYIEQDIHDHTRQATAFSLLKAVLSKKLEAIELPGVMKKIAEMAITSEQDHIRTQSRQVSLQYMLEYPLGKNLTKSFSFYVSQLDYFHEHGRISAMEVITSIVNYCPTAVIKKNTDLFLVPLALRLVNDESSACRKKAAGIIKKMLEKVDHDERSRLFSFIHDLLLDDSKLSHRRLGAQLCGIFAEVERQKFERSLQKVLPIIQKQLEETKDTEVQSHTDERCTDHYLYHLLNAVIKILMNCSIIKNSKFTTTLNSIWSDLQKIILHPHSWVRLLVSQLFGLLFSSYSVDEIVIAVSGPLNEKNSIFLNSRQKLRDLSADFITQLQSPLLNDSLGEQVIKNLVYLSKVIANLPEKVSNGSMERSHDSKIKTSESTDENVEVTLSWIMRKLSREVRKEVAKSPQSSLKRRYIFKFFAAVCLDLNKDIVLSFIEHILPPLCRELADSSKNIDQSLTSLAKEVLDVLSNVLGLENFTTYYAAAQSVLARKKFKRKRERLAEAVTDPEKFAKKKIKKQLNKKESRKRKILMLKGKKKSKKTKLSDLAFDS